MWIDRRSHHTDDSCTTHSLFRIFRTKKKKQKNPSIWFIRHASASAYGLDFGASVMRLRFSRSIRNDLRSFWRIWMIFGSQWTTCASQYSSFLWTKTISSRHSIDRHAFGVVRTIQSCHGCASERTCIESNHLMQSEKCRIDGVTMKTQTMMMLIEKL